MALEKLIIRRDYAPHPHKPRSWEVEIDFAVGKSSMRGDPAFIDALIELAEMNMPQEPCTAAVEEGTDLLAQWTAQPFTKKDDFKVMLYVHKMHIVGDHYIGLIQSEKPLGWCLDSRELDDFELTPFILEGLIAFEKRKPHSEVPPYAKAIEILRKQKVRITDKALDDCIEKLKQEASGNKYQPQSFSTKPDANDDNRMVAEERAEYKVDKP